MLKFIVKILSVFAVLCVFFSFEACCDETEDGQKISFENKKQKKDSLENLNKYFVAREKEAIKDYITKKGINIVETGTGLCYRIINQGDGELIKTGDIVTLDYQIRLLNDSLLYHSGEKGFKIFEVGHGGVESGLEEAVLLLHKGDEAEIIIPSHLAYGLLGDGDRIPSRATIVYNVKIIDNQSKR